MENALYIGLANVRLRCTNRIYGLFSRLAAVHVLGSEKKRFEVNRVENALVQGASQDLAIYLLER